MYITEQQIRCIADLSPAVCETTLSILRRDGLAAALVFALGA